MEQFAAVKRSKDGQPVRYLIVDDSVFARKNLARMIETFGGQVAAEAGDGLTAISEFERTHPDIVLMDITMPQMEGIEAAGIPGKHCGRIAARGAAFRAKTGEAGGFVRSHQVRSWRRWRCGRLGRRGGLDRDEDGTDSAFHQRGGRRAVARPVIHHKGRPPFDGRGCLSPQRRGRHGGAFGRHRGPHHPRPRAANRGACGQPLRGR